MTRYGTASGQAFGLADRAEGQPWTLQTRSQAASVSKQLVAACALILSDRGVIQLEDAVTRTLPNAAPGWDEVSLRHLMTHTSGLSHWGCEPGFTASESMPAADRLGLLLASAPSDAPGTAFRYSSPGYVVLSAALAAATCQSYEKLARELILEPLGMTSTHLGLPRPGLTARGYRSGRPVPSWDLTSMPGTGDMWSTAADLARFVSALHTGHLLPAAVQESLYQPGLPLNAAPGGRLRAEAYHAGHFSGSLDGPPAFLHPGDNPGYQCLVVWLPETSTSVVILTNEETADVEAIATKALEDAEVGKAGQ